MIGGPLFSKLENEELVREVAAELGRKLGQTVLFITEGMPGIQKVFARNLGEGVQVVNLMQAGKDSGYGVGRDLHADVDQQGRREVFASLADVYVAAEGGPADAEEARLAAGRGARLVPLGRTGGAAAGRFNFPVVGQPAGISEAQWAALQSPESDVPAKQAAEAAAAAVAACLVGRPCAVPREAEERRSQR